MITRRSLIKLVAGLPLIGRALIVPTPQIASNVLKQYETLHDFADCPGSGDPLFDQITATTLEELRRGIVYQNFFDPQPAKFDGGQYLKPAFIFEDDEEGEV